MNTRQAKKVEREAANALRRSELRLKSSEFDLRFSVTEARKALGLK